MSRGWTNHSSTPQFVPVSCSQTSLTKLRTARRSSSVTNCARDILPRQVSAVAVHLGLGSLLTRDSCHHSTGSQWPTHQQQDSPLQGMTIFPVLTLSVLALYACSCMVSGGTTRLMNIGTENSVPVSLCATQIT